MPDSTSGRMSLDFSKLQSDDGRRFLNELTNSDGTVLALNPRGEMAQLPLLKRAAWMPSASSSASAIVVTPARRMSSEVMTEIAAAVVPTGSRRREVVVTSIRINSSIDSRLRSS